MKKLLFVVLDGGADTPNDEIDGKTAFEAAEIPNIDFLARNGINGTMQILPIPPESDEAVIALLGYNVFKVYTGRGPLEAIGGGLSFKNGDLAIRCNFASEEDGKIVNVRAGHIDAKDSKEIEKSINEYVTLTDAEFEFKSTAGYRSVLVIKSKEELSPKISNTHPGYQLRLFDIVWDKSGEIQYAPLSEAIKKPLMEVKSCQPLERTKAAIRSAKLVNEFIRKSKLVMDNHPVNEKRIAEGKAPANILLMRDTGNKRPELYNLTKTYDAKWACLADMPVERGISQLAGMEIIPLPPPSVNMEQDMTTRILTVLKNIHLYDAFYIHLKGPDVFAHVGDIKGKVKSLEVIDKHFFKPLIKNIDLENTIIVITCDHTTSCAEKSHTEHPVPLAIFGIETPDNISKFSEETCKQGDLGFIHAKSLMSFVMKYMK